MLDRLDKKLLKAISANENGRVFDVIKPFGTEKSSRALRNRLKVLSKEGYVTLEKQRANVLVNLTAAGKKEASGVV